MVKTINLDDNHSIELNSSVGWLIKYKNQFGHDILPDLMPMLVAVVEMVGGIVDENEEITIESVKSAIFSTNVDSLYQLAGLEFSTILQVVWALAKNADRNIEPPEEWAENQEVFPLDVVIPEVMEMIMSSSVSSKNFERLKRAVANLRANLSQSKISS